MIISAIGNNGGIGISTLLANFFITLHKKNSNTFWLSLSNYVPSVLLSNNNQWVEKEAITRPIPKWDRTHCKFCSECEKVCQCGAISRYGDFYVVYSELCISCAACIYACKKQSLIFEEKKIGTLEHASNNQHIYRVNLNPREVFSPWHTKVIVQKIKHIFPKDSIVLLDAPSGFRELWSDLIDLSDVVILYTNDLNMWETLYKSLAHDQAFVILAVSEEYYDTFAQAGYSFALSIPRDKTISQEAVQGKVISNDNYQQTINELLIKLNLD